MPLDASILRDRARGLRRKQTDSERKLWERLRARQLHSAKFRRQFAIGPFIVDFCCFEERLVVELDGGHHANQTAADKKRCDFLISRGYRILRFWDNEVMEDLNAVLEKIRQTLDDQESEPSP